MAEINNKNNKMSKCQAIMRNGMQCWQNAKYGTFCGCHNPNKIITQNKLCNGLTKCGKQCTKQVKFGEFCNIHLHSEVNDNNQFLLYQPDVNWPYMDRVQSSVRKFNNGKDLNRYIENNVLSSYRYSSIFPIEPIEITQREYLYRMIMAELFFRNFYLDFNTPHWQKIITETQEYLKDFPFMSKYREYFRKKFDQQFRIETQKKFVEVVLNQSILEKNTTKKIISLL
jgi:hypothetical protein